MREEMIKKYVDLLTKSLGKVRTPVDEVELLKLFEAKDYAGMLGWVKKSMKLECRFRLGLVNAGGAANSPAWVESIDPMPMAGTPAFKATQITVFLRKSFIENATFEEVVFAIAHELSHIVLDSIKHSLRREEEAVDLTAMLLGYRDFYITGCQRRVVEPQTWSEKVSILIAGFFGYDTFRNVRTYSLGYLKRDEINYAAQYMSTGK